MAVNFAIPGDMTVNQATENHVSFGNNSCQRIPFIEDFFVRRAGLVMSMGLNFRDGLPRTSTHLPWRSLKQLWWQLGNRLGKHETQNSDDKDKTGRMHCVKPNAIMLRLRLYPDWRKMRRSLGLNNVLEMTDPRLAPRLGGRHRRPTRSCGYGYCP